MRIPWKRYAAYLLRWQASTPLLAGITLLLAAHGSLIAAAVANLIGGLLFFWVDRIILTTHALDEAWEVRDRATCTDCGKVARGYRLVLAKGYDRRDAVPEFRCEACSEKKARDRNG